MRVRGTRVKSWTRAKGKSLAGGVCGKNDWGGRAGLGLAGRMLSAGSGVEALSLGDLYLYLGALG